MQRLAILGANGQLGSELARLAGEAWSVTALTRHVFDAVDPAGLEGLLSAAEPQVVINCVAATHVDRCEDEPEMARRINTSFAGAAASASRAIGARFVQVSTDFVFGGGAERSPLAEDAARAPVNVYGRTKADGEDAAREACADCQVVRVAALYGHAGASGKGGNFVETMLKLARDQAEIAVVADQVTSPTHAPDAAAAILHLAKHTGPGVYHAAGAGQASWFDLAEAALRESGLTSSVRPISTADYPTRAARPAYSALSNAKLDASGFAMPPWRDGLARYLAGRAAHDQG